MIRLESLSAVASIRLANEDKIKIKRWTFFSRFGCWRMESALVRHPSVRQDEILGLYPHQERYHRCFLFPNYIFFSLADICRSMDGGGGQLSVAPAATKFIANDKVSTRAPSAKIENEKN